MADEEKDEVQLKYSGTAITGFIAGLVCIFFNFGMIPVIGLILNIVALSTFKPEIQKGRWMAVIGLLLSGAYLFVYLYGQGYLNI